MFIFSYNSIIILSYLLSVNSIKIEKIQDALIVNSTATLQSDCSTCICQCMPYLSSSSLCCYVNCYINNNTCQVIISASTSNPVIIIDTTSIVYKANCSLYSNTTISSTENHARPAIQSTNQVISSITTTATTITTTTTTKTTTITATTIATEMTTITATTITITTTTTPSTITYKTLWWCPMCTGK